MIKLWKLTKFCRSIRTEMKIELILNCTLGERGAGGTVGVARGVAGAEGDAQSGRLQHGEL